MKEKLKELFPQFELELIDKIYENGIIREVKKGEKLMQTGQYVKSTMLVLEGRVKLMREDEWNPKEFFMYYILPGNACALSMVCANREKTMDIMGIADEDSTLLMIPTPIMDELIREFKSWYYFVVETYRNRFEELLELVDNIAFKKMDEQLWSYLKNYQEKTGESIMNATHQEVATDLNSSREVISRLLKQLEERSYVSLGRNKIEILK
ncbi:MAG TPA: Crp/Fnr family transcriptional regulator [Chitinophagaceae bacterium]|nr:Crp/Fnr family transcriptional regulator [Chitinophagaceae bacterium]